MAINSVSLKQDERTFNSSFMASAYQGSQKKENRVETALSEHPAKIGLLKAGELTSEM